MLGHAEVSRAWYSHTFKGEFYWLLSLGFLGHDLIHFLGNFERIFC